MSGQQNHGHSRPRSSTLLSFGSAGSGPKYTKDELQESPKEKAAKRISTKANPNVAMNEVEPVVQALMQPTMDSNLRGMEHRDMYGNVITDPDRSNPTRSRLERPLDTIRSFEAAIDGKYGRMSNYPDTPAQSRPASAYFGTNDSHNRRRSIAGMNGMNGNRSGRPESYVDSSMYGSANRRSPAPFGGSQRRAFGPGNRNQSDPMMYGNGAYAQPPRKEQYQPSHESAGSSGGSGGTENWNPGTDPSTPSSSVDRFQQQQQHQPPAPPKHDIGEQYGFSGFGGGPQTGLDYEQQGQRQGQGQNGHPPQYGNNQQYARDGVPPPPPHKGHGPGATNGQTNRPLAKTPSYGPPQTQKPVVEEKRKSWLMRRLSRK